MKRTNETFQQKLERLLGQSRRAPADRMESGINEVWDRLNAIKAQASTETSSRFVVVPHRWRGSTVGVALALAIAITVTVLSIPFIRAIISPGRVYAIVETVHGSVYRVSEGAPVIPGERIDAGTALRTDAGAAAVLKLPDGATIEMPGESQVSLEHANNSVTIRVNDGSVRVTPAKQPARGLYVQNRDVTVPVLAAVVESGVAPQAVVAATPPTQGPEISKWEAVSVKSCNDDSIAAVPGGRGGGSGPRISPGRLTLECMNIQQMIQFAYVRNGEPLLNGRGYGRTAGIEGGPDWVRSAKVSDKYTVDAKAEGDPPERAVMQGPMTRALLEDRFQLKLHRETQEVPMYAMTVAKGGLKIKPVGPDCRQYRGERTTPWGINAAILAGEKPFCGTVQGATHGPNITWYFGGSTMDNFANQISGNLDRHVLNRTGVEGAFAIFLEFLRDDIANVNFAEFPPQQDPSILPGPSIITAIEELGLKLEPTRGPRQFIVIDRIERPAEN